MKFPYGISDFYEIRTENYFYVDRTDKIVQLEKAGKHLLFLRPRRFGKSLLLSMLKNYYDVAKRDEFSNLFADLKIGQKPSNKHNQYFILKLDFSAVSSVGDKVDIEQNLHDHINGRIELFKVYYRQYLDYDIVLDKRNSLRSLHSVLAAIQQTPYKLYLLIDEYDNFANELMMTNQFINQQQYEKLLYGEGFFRTVFKTIKSLSEDQGIDRVFITGVSPVVMSDITSGYNIAKNIFLLPEFYDLCGFHEKEIEETLFQITSECDLPDSKTHEALAMMKIFYDGYIFSDNQKHGIYNPSLALYFLEHLYNYCDYPRKIVDSNLAMDSNRITYISQLTNGRNFIFDLIDKDNPFSITELVDRFGIDDMLKRQQDNVFIASLLYYLGVVTMKQSGQTGDIVLVIPNLVVQKLYIERILELLLPDINKNEANRATKSLYKQGNMQPLCSFMEKSFFKVFDNRDYRWSNELTIKTAFLAVLFNDTYYIMDSEPPLIRDYADLTMIIRPDMRKYQLLDILIEFKYISLQELGKSGAEIKELKCDKLKELPLVQKKIKESKKKLTSYQKILLKRYNHNLNLKVYSVVAIGFERLLCQEIQ